MMYYNKEHITHRGMRNLVIVESAAKAQTIAKYLNSIPELASLGGFVVKASFGHVTEIPAKELGVDVATWTATYAPIAAKAKVIAELKKAAKAADVVYLASDLDHEGEAIAYHLRKLLALPEACPRITFNEITPQALKRAVLTPGRVDLDAVAAQESRRMLDRVVGYELSPLLWRRFATGKLSAGRVQSAALKMLVDRAQEAAAHEPVPYWTLEGVFALGAGAELLEAKAYDGTTLRTWSTAKEIKALLKSLAAAKVKWTAAYAKKATTRNPSAPFTTSTLQQEAYSAHGLPAKRTMQLAQALYEAGHITYMRTDSVHLSPEAKADICAWLDKTHPGTAEDRDYKARAGAQQAHEAIRPTDPSLRPRDLPLSEGITATHKKLYDLIWRRTVASQMKGARYTDVSFQIEAAGSRSALPVFKGKHSFLIEPGYLAVYSPDTKPQEVPDASDKPVAVVPQTFTCPGDVTRAPPLYNEPALVKALEAAGIGRPSTYATIVDKLYDKGYVVKGTAPQKTVHVTSYALASESETTLVLGGKESDRMVPSSLGERVVEYLDGVVPYLLDAGFTATMETDLDAISAGDIKQRAMLDPFYKRFHDSVVRAEEAGKAIAVENKKKKRECLAAATTAEEKAACKPPPKAALVPKNVLRDFPEAGAAVVQTRFGPALFGSGRFVSIVPFMKWRGLTLDELADRDVAFLLALPLPVAGRPDQELTMGRFGLYIKDTTTGANVKMTKEERDEAYEAFTSR